MNGTITVPVVLFLLSFSTPSNIRTTQPKGFEQWQQKKNKAPDQKSKDLDYKFSKDLGLSSNKSATFWTWKLLTANQRLDL